MKDISMHQSPDFSISSANFMCKQRESCIQSEVWWCRYSSWGCLNIVAGSDYRIRPLSFFFGGGGVSSVSVTLEVMSFPVGLKRTQYMKGLCVKFNWILGGDKAGSNVRGCMWRWYLLVLQFSVNPWAPLLVMRTSSEDVLEFHCAHVVLYHYCCLAVLHLLYLHTY